MAGRTILLATDFSECSTATLGVVAEYAKALNAHVHIVHIFPLNIPYPPFYFGDASPLPALVLSEAQRATVRANVQTEMKNWLGSAGRQFPHDLVVLEGIAGEELVRYARQTKCNLIIIGTHGYGFFKRALLGSVAQFLMLHAPCPVMTVKAAAAPAAKGE